MDCQLFNRRKQFSTSWLGVMLAMEHNTYYQMPLFLLRNACLGWAHHRNLPGLPGHPWYSPYIFFFQICSLAVHHVKQNDYMCFKDWAVNMNWTWIYDLSCIRNLKYLRMAWIYLGLKYLFKLLDTCMVNANLLVPCSDEVPDCTNWTNNIIILSDSWLPWLHIRRTCSGTSRKWCFFFFTHQKWECFH